MTNEQIQKLIDNVMERYPRLTTGDSVVQSKLIEVAQLQLKLNESEQLPAGTLLNMAEQQAQSDSVEEYIEKKLDAIASVTDLAIEAHLLGGVSKVDVFVLEPEAERIVDTVITSFGLKRLFDE